MTETDEAELALAQVAADIIESISLARAMELTAGLPGKPPGLTPRQRDAAFAHNPDYRALKGIPPLTPGAGHWCGFCGNPDESQLEIGCDGQKFGTLDDWICKDQFSRQCTSRRERRWPPRPEMVPEGIMAALAAADEHDAARLSRQQPARQQPAQQQEPAQPAAAVPVSQAAAYGGWYDQLGQWHAPGLPQWNAWSHTIAGGAHTGHLLSGQQGAQRPHYYAGPGYIPLGMLSGAEGSQAHRDTSTEIPPYGVPPGVAEALHGQHGVDVAMVPGKESAAAPHRPARRPGPRSYYRGKFRGRLAADQAI